MKASSWRVTVVVSLLAVSLVVPAVRSPTTAAAGAGPDVSGPITGGARTGGPWLAAPFDLAAHGYVEEEYFLSGAATNHGYTGYGIPNAPPSPTVERRAPYRVRLLVRRPADPARFNGTAVLEWANVSNQMDFEATWGESHEYLMERGYVSATVSAQKAGVDQPPLGMRYWDPVRYGSLVHPGDDFSYDVFAQAARALRQPPPGSTDPLAGLRPDVIIGAGASQSCFRLVHYVNFFAEADAAFDAFHPSVCVTSSIRTDVVPILWVNTETEPASQGDRGQLRLWELAGASHLGWYALRFGAASAHRDLSAGLGLDTQQVLGALAGLVPQPVEGLARLLGPWDEATAGSYGEDGQAGPCPQNLFPTRWVYNAALDHLRRWVVDGVPPPVAERFPRTVPTRADRGDALNVKGGVRLPPIDVPIATYLADVPCIFVGSTIPFTPLALRLRYPTHRSYVCAIDAAATRTVDAGFLLPDDAEELRARAAGATLWGPPPAPAANVRC